MATDKDKAYNIDAAKQAANTGWTGDLSKYGIDYSQEQRDAIAGIFQEAANKAYQTSQNEFSNSMASQQASLQDTIRRSQAQAVATGASRGMQAANELSSMLGLQQAAAQEASAMQGTYAEALASAQQKAYDVQNAANQIGMQGYIADSASEAQKYAANMEAYMNDPYRVLTEIQALRNSGNNAAADALMTNWMTSHGATESQVAGSLSQNSGSNYTPAVKYNSSTGQGIVSSSLDGWAADVANYADLDDTSKAESFTAKLTVGTSTKEFKLKATKDDELYSNSSATGQALAKLAGGAGKGNIVAYNGKLYIYTGSNWRSLSGDQASKALNFLKTNG